jgi:DNA modification methylase
MKAGRHFIGIDIDKDYVEKANERMELLAQRNRLRKLLQTQSKPGKAVDEK